MTKLFSRKHLLGRAAVVTGGAIVAGGIVASAVAAPVELPVYLLDPDWGSGDPLCPTDESARTRSCHGCNACHRHALNALFASAVAADLFRAHPYCKCAVVQGPMVPYDAWVALFGAPTAIARYTVDRRTPWVSDVLAAASAPPALASAPSLVPSSPPASSTSSSSSTPPAIVSIPGAADPQVISVVGGWEDGSPAAPVGRTRLAVRSIHSGKVKRTLALRFGLMAPASTQVRLIDSRGRIVVLRNFQAAAGKSLHTLHIPNGVRPGRYRIAVVLRTSDGSRHSLLRYVFVS